MISRVGQRTFAALLSLIAFTTPAAAQYSTPGALAVRFQVEAHQLGDYTTFNEVVTKYNYSYLTYVSATLGTYPDVTTWDLVNVYNARPGWLWFMAHTRSTSFDTESYEYTDPGRTARDNAWTDLKNTFGSSTVFKETRYDAVGNPEYYVIYVTEQFVADHFQSENSLVLHAGCYGWYLKEGYQSAGVRAFVSFNDTLTNGAIFSNSNSLWARLMSPTMRVVRDAVPGINPKMQASDPSGTVLAPTAWTSLDGVSSISGTTSVTVWFDCPMNQVTVTDVVRATGSLSVINAAWAAPDRITCTVKPRYQGSGKLIVDAYNPRLIELTGAMSAVGHIGLDGNQDPWIGDDGVAPNGDNHVVALTSTTGGDNPAASVSAFTAMRETDGVHIRWSVDLESNTQLYGVERSDGWHGPWTMVGSVTATGAHQYESVDPDGQAGQVYQLVEVETSGREVVHAQEVAVPSFSIPPDQMVTEAMAESLNAALLQQYPTPPNQPDDINPVFGWVAIIPDETYRSAIQPLVNYRQSQGKVAQAMTLAELDAWGGIKPFVSWALPYGLRYLLICGDANNAVVHDDPSSWVNGWTYPGYSSQPQHNLIPMDNFRDPWDVQSQSLTWFTRHYGTDVLKVDVTGDSLPDIASGRFPCRTPAELSVMAAKTMAGEQQASVDAIGVWGEFRDLSGLDGEYGRVLCDSIVTTRLAGRTVYPLYNTNSNPIPYPTREQMAIAAMNAGRVIVMTFGTQSNRAKWALWYDKTQGFAWTKVSNSYLSFLLAASCDIIDIDRSEDPAFGRPLIELAMLELNKGPFMAAGFTRGTFQYWDFLVASEFLRIIYGPGASSAGEAWMIAIQNVAWEHPEAKAQAMSALFLGDPVATIPGMVVNQTTDVARGNGSGRVFLASPYPNPSRGMTQLSFSLAMPAHVELSVYDLAGREVGTVADQQYEAGSHTVRWDGTGLKSGLYFAALKIGATTLTQKMTLLR